MATAVCEAIKKRYPLHRLIVISHHPAVFLGNPFVDFKLGFNELSYLYQEMGQERPDNLYFLLNPELANDVVSGAAHVLPAWCALFGIPYTGEMPRLFLTRQERLAYGSRFAGDKPIMVIQTGEDPAGKYNWTRDLPSSIAQRIVDHFSGVYRIYHIRSKDQPELKHTESVTEPDFRAWVSLIGMSAKRLFIDGFGQHIAAALGLPSVVCWLATRPAQYGYTMHTNVVANKPTVKSDLKHSTFTKFNRAGMAVEFCYRSENEVFDVGLVVGAIIGQRESASIEHLIRLEQSRGSMVAARLSHLLGRVALGGIKRILDIGSRDILQSVEFSNVFASAVIDAFEPVPESFAMCEFNHSKLTPERRQQIRVHNIALSDVSGTIPFYSVDPEKSRVPNVGASSLFRFTSEFDGLYVQQEISVRSETLDAWCATNGVEQVDLMWVDAQGSELLVFRGADSILHNTGIIMTEVGLKPYYEGHTLKADIDRYLGERGFVELEGAFELQPGFDYEGNTIYVKKEILLRTVK